ncbi:unnamed protein product [Pedinophyceae sp. YPF-701]|nr:unnamed protein product [Pedinophyceae sp. YPF-701]
MVQSLRMVARLAALVAALVSVALVPNVALATDTEESMPGVVDLDSSNFDTVVTGAKGAFVEFYAPWCGHCKHLAPEFKKLGAAVTADASLRSRVTIGKVNADTHRALGQKFGVQGFPTLMYFPRGVRPTSDKDAVPYNGARSAGAIADWIRDQLADDEDFARVADLDELAIDFLAGKQGDALEGAQAYAAGKTGDEKANAEAYVAIMKKIIDKGSEYPAKERARLGRVLASGSVAADRLQAMRRKHSVLGAFVDDEE